MHVKFLLPNGNSVNHQLPEDRPRHIVLRSDRLAVTPSLEDGDHEYGRITSSLKGTKVEAVKLLHVLPGNSSVFLEHHPSDIPSEAYELQPASGVRCEIIILRHGDVITSPGTSGHLTYVHHSSEVQVNSSAAEEGQAKAPLVKVGIEATPEDETEDEDVSDQTVTEVPRTQPITQQTKSQPSATPQLMTLPSAVIQETPTADRTSKITDDDRFPAAIAVTETFSTARTDQSRGSNTHAFPDYTDGQRPQASPEIRIGTRRGRKRPSAEPSLAVSDELSVGDRPMKRTKNDVSNDDEEDNINDASPLDDIHAKPARTTYSAKARRRLGVTAEITPTKSTRSSQRSETATTVAAYEGKPPRMATSNSAITETSSAIKFLRKNGGTLLSSVDDDCNILCVRDGGLAKTMKVFQAIALGIPIVTDKWLIDSAKAGYLYDLSAYKPSVAQQEKDWDFKLERVWATAQTPFKGYSVYFTPTLKKSYTSFREIEQVCTAVGAKVVGRYSKNDKMIALATGVDDPDVEKWLDDEACYQKDLLTTSILRGKLDLQSDEFKIKARPTGAVRRKGPRKST